MRTALIGHTGFVGSTLARSAPFDALFNSANIEAIAGQTFDLVVCAGARAEKWRINAEPAMDTADLQRLTAALGKTKATCIVLVSTVDVYPAPEGVDEDSWIDIGACAPYGGHRLALEHFVATRFDTLVMRLPGLFGPGLKKNVIYDFLHANMLDRIHPDSRFQFYDVTRLWADLQRARSLKLRLLNVATEPVSVRRIAREAFGTELTVTPRSAPVSYDFRSRHAQALGGRNGYLYDAAGVIDDLKAFVAVHRGTSA